MISTEKKLVTVITAVKNAKNVISRCVDSVLNQTYDNIEHLLIAGDSLDGTNSIIEDYQNKNADRIKVVPEIKPGIYSALNQGITLSQGNYILILGADDWLEADGIQILLESIMTTKSDFAVGYALVREANGKLAKNHLYKIKNFDHRILTGSMPFCHQALLASKYCFEICGLFNEVLKISSDYEWVKKLFLNKLKMNVVNKPVVNFSLGGCSSNKKIYYNEHVSVLSAEYNLPKKQIVDYLNYIHGKDSLHEQDIYTLVKSITSVNSFDLMKSVALHLLDKLCQMENNKPLTNHEILLH